MISVRPAQSPAEARELARAVWTTLFTSQRVYGLDALQSADKLAAAWARFQEVDGDVVLGVYDGDTLLGAGGVQRGADGAQVILSCQNGPVALARHEEVFDAFFDTCEELSPGAVVWCGISVRNRVLGGWLQEHAALVDRHVPLRLPLPLPKRLERPEVPVHRVGTDEQDRLRTAMAHLVDQMWWNADRIIEAWERWIVVATEDFAGWAVAMRTRQAPELHEIFAMEGPDAVTRRSLVRGLLQAGAAYQPRELVYFAESEEEARDLEPEGLRVVDEYLLYSVLPRADRA